MATPIRRDHRLEHLGLREQIDIAVHELGEQFLGSEARIDGVVGGGGAPTDISDAKVPHRVKAEIPRRRNRGRDQRHEVRRKLGADREHAARNVRTGAVDSRPAREGGQGIEGGAGNELVSPAGWHHRAEPCGEAGMRELDGGGGSRGELRVVAENHHGRRVSSADICRWWQRRHA